MSFVYVVSYEEGTYKIGSAKDVMKRIASLQTASPSQLKINAVYECADRLQTEKTAHDRFAAARIMGEWFSIDFSEIDSWFVSNGYQPIEVKTIASKQRVLIEKPKPYDQSGEAFCAWVRVMRLATNASEAMIADHLGVTEIEFATMKEKGANRSVALACAALFHRFEPYS